MADFPTPDRRETEQQLLLPAIQQMSVACQIIHETTTISYLLVQQQVQRKTAF